MKRQILPQSVTVQKVFLAFSKHGAIIIEIFKRKSVEKERAILQNKAESPNEIMLTAYVNGELAGNCSLASQGDKRRTKHRCCVSIALYEKYCNLGLGRILLNTLLGLAKQCGYTQAELGVIEGNERAKHVYERLGFKEYGFLPNSMRYSDGTTRGEYFMVKEL